MVYYNNSQVDAQSGHGGGGTRMMGIGHSDSNHYEHQQHASNGNYYPTSYSSPNRNRQQGGGVGQQHLQQLNAGGSRHQQQLPFPQHQQSQPAYNTGRKLGGGNGNDHHTDSAIAPGSWHSNNHHPNHLGTKTFEKMQRRGSFEPLAGSSHHNSSHKYHSHQGKGNNNNPKDAGGFGASNHTQNTQASTGSGFQHSYKKPVMPNRQLYLAFDCEMVGTVLGDSVTARVVLIDWKGRVVLDTYVNPTDVAGEITDYRTPVSGITAEKLQAAPSFAAVRAQVQSLIADKILVGHAIDNDLKSLNLEHPWTMIRDTAYYQPFMKERHPSELSSMPPSSSFHGPTISNMIIGSSNHGSNGCGNATPSGPNSNNPDCWAPRKLKELAKEKLQRDIQVPGEPHCPVQDAMAALDLYKSHRPRWEACITTQIQKEQKRNQQQQQLSQGRSHYNSNHNNTTNNSRGGQGQLLHHHSSHNSTNRPTHHHMSLESSSCHTSGTGGSLLGSSSHNNPSYQHPYGNTGQTGNTSIPLMRTVSAGTSLTGNHGGGSGMLGGSLHRATTTSSLIPTPPGFQTVGTVGVGGGSMVTGLDDSFSLHSSNSSIHGPPPGSSIPNTSTNPMRRSVSNVNSGAINGGGGNSNNPWAAPPGFIGGPSSLNNNNNNSSIILSSSFHSASSSCSRSTAFGGGSFHGGMDNDILGNGFHNGPTTSALSKDADDWAANLGMSHSFDSVPGSGLLLGGFGSSVLGGGGNKGLGPNNNPIPGLDSLIAPGAGTLLNSGGSSHSNSNRSSRSNSLGYLSNDVLAGLNELSLTTPMVPSTIGGGYMNPAQLYSSTGGGKKVPTRAETSSIFSSASSFTDDSDCCSSLDGNSFHDPSRDLF